MTQTSTATQDNDGLTVDDPSIYATARRLVAKFRYDPPKVVSFPIDSKRMTGPVTLAGNS
jgi:hypothetical protein